MNERKMKATPSPKSFPQFTFNMPLKKTAMPNNQLTICQMLNFLSI